MELGKFIIIWKKQGSIGSLKLKFKLNGDPHKLIITSLVIKC